MSSKPSSSTAAQPARVLLVDDHPMLRFGLAQLLNGQDDLTVCGEAEDGPTALQLLAEKRPDLVIVDIALKGMDGIELIKRIRSRNQAVRILVLSMYDEVLYAGRALRAGANGYVMKDEAGAKVLAALRPVLQGEIYVSDRVASRILKQFATGTPEVVASPVEQLTDRELTVFRLLGRGLTTKQIARDLHISDKTVESHRLHIKQKLKISTLAELIHHAVSWAEKEGAE